MTGKKEGIHIFIPIDSKLGLEFLSQVTKGETVSYGL
jgi:hypothetical protein